MISGTVLAFDYGLRRIGVAVGNTLTGTATAQPLLPARDGVPDWDRLRRLIEEWKPALLLVGLPLNMDGTPSEMSERAARFSRRLHGRFGIACELVDERLSSFEARGRLAAEPPRAPRSGARATTAALDSVAACVILEGWFAARAGGG